MSDQNALVPLVTSSVVSAIVPNDFDSVLEFGKLIAASGLAPSTIKGPEAVAVALLHGMELGFTPMAALNSIAVINGRPSVWGDGALALCESSGLMADFHEEFVGEGDKLKAVCTVQRKGRSKPTVGEFSMEDAKKAKLLDKTGPWKDYTKRMLKMRARAFALRDAFADVFRGLAIAEEMQDIGEGTVVQKTPPAPPAAEAKKDSPPAPKEDPVDAEFEAVAETKEPAKKENPAAGEAERMRKRVAEAKAETARKAEEAAAAAAMDETIRQESQKAEDLPDDDEIDESEPLDIPGEMADLAARNLPFSAYISEFNTLLSKATDDETIKAAYANRMKVTDPEHKQKHVEVVNRHRERVKNPPVEEQGGDGAAAGDGAADIGAIRAELAGYVDRQDGHAIMAFAEKVQGMVEAGNLDEAIFRSELEDDFMSAIDKFG